MGLHVMMAVEGEVAPALMSSGIWAVAKLTSCDDDMNNMKSIPMHFSVDSIEVVRGGRVTSMTSKVQ